MVAPLTTTSTVSLPERFVVTHSKSTLVVPGATTSPSDGDVIVSVEFTWYPSITLMLSIAISSSPAPKLKKVSLISTC